MRHVITSILVAGCVSSTAVAFQARGSAPAAGSACALLTRDLAMKVSTPEGRKLLEGTKASADSEGMAVAKQASTCYHGLVTLVLEPAARPDQVRKDMRAGTPLYKNHEPVAGVGDEAFFTSNSQFAYLYVWSGSHHFMIEMGKDLGGDAKTLKPNVVELGKAVVAKLR
jgi:hypothetical protein